MDDPRVVSRDEWLAASRQLLAREKEFTRQRDALNTGRRKLPMVEIDKEYTFRGPDGQAGLPDLFQGRGQLLIYHFMFDPDWDEGCESCSYLADGIGHLAHLHARDTTLAMVSRAPLPKLEAFRQRMGWTVPWYSSSGSDFNYDFHATLDPAVAPAIYNYQSPEEAAANPVTESTEVPGLSCFLRDRDRIFHTYSTFARGTDQIGNAYTLLDLTALGRSEAWEEPKGRVADPHGADPSFGGFGARD